MTTDSSSGGAPGLGNVATALRHALPVTIAVALGACGGDSDSLRPGGSTITGNVTRATTAMVATERSWLARAGSIVGWPEIAHAQGGPDTSLGGIVVSVRGESGREATGITDASGTFTISGAPTGSIDVVFRRGSCEAGVPVGAVPSQSTIVLGEVTFDCDEARPGRIDEAFESVLRKKPGSPNANLDVCARIGDGDRTRSVQARNAAIVGPAGEPLTFGDLREDDRLAVQGRRTGVGAPSTLIASSVRVLERDVDDPCEGDPFEEL